MAKIEVFDPPMCCSSGVCGPEPDSRLSAFAADVKWLHDQGVEVRRYNLVQEPGAFVANPLVRKLLDTTGDEGLPVVLLDGQVAFQGEYPSRQQLEKLAGLNGHAEAANNDSGLIGITPPPVFDERVAELVALGAAVAANCESCLEYHHRQAVKLGIAHDDMIQAVNVALRVKDQPAQAIVRLAQQLLMPASAGGCCDGGNGGKCC